MKHEIIYTDDYALIVSDEEINDVRPYKGKFHIEKGYIINQFPDYLTDLSDCKLIIAHQPLTDAPVLEAVPLLPEFNKKDDVEKKSRDFVKYVGGSQEQRLAFIDGYLEAKETYKYVEEDLRKALLIKHDGLSVDYVIQSLQTKRPKYFKCETEVKCTGNNNNGCFLESPGHDCGCAWVYPTIINSQGQTELKGEYSYE
jgi:hypothetical protein